MNLYLPLDNQLAMRDPLLGRWALEWTCCERVWLHTMVWTLTGSCTQSQPARKGVSSKHGRRNMVGQRDARQAIELLREDSERTVGLNGWGGGASWLACDFCLHTVVTVLDVLSIV